MRHNDDHLATKTDLFSLEERLRRDLASKEDLNRFATKEDISHFATKDDLTCFATKDDLARFATKDDIALLTPKDDFRRLVIAVVNLQADVRELKERIPPPSYFSGIMELLDGIAKNLSDQGQRLTAHTMLWEKLESRTQENRRHISDHEARISRLES